MLVQVLLGFHKIMFIIILIIPFQIILIDGNNNFIVFNYLCLKIVNKILIVLVIKIVILLSK